MPEDDRKGNGPTPTSSTVTPNTPNTPNIRRRRRRRKNDAPAQTRPESKSKNEVQPPVTAPPQRGRNKRPLAAPRMAVGCVVLRGDEVLIVRERGRWSLPKGGLEVGELIQEGARRETYEETGLIVEIRELAFMVEFQAESWGHHIQYFYACREVGGTLGPRDPDRDVQEAKFVPIRHLREYLRFRPRLVALETWLRDRRPKHLTFNLDKEPAMLKKRTRVETGAGRKAAPSATAATLERITFEAEDELP